MSDVLAAFITSGKANLLSIIAIIVWLDLRGTIKLMGRSIENLNNKMGIIVERVDSHEKRIDKLEDK